MPTTTRHALRYPASTASPDVPTDMNNAMTDVDLAIPYVSSTTPTSPVAGLVWYNSTTGVTQIYDGSAWKNLSSPLWQAYTPTWSASGTSPSLGNGTLFGRYVQLGPKTVCFRVKLITGSTTSGGTGVYTFALPVQGATDQSQFVEHRIATAGATINFLGFGYIPASSTTVQPYAAATNGSAQASQVAGGSPGLSTGSEISIWGTYETA